MKYALTFYLWFDSVDYKYLHWLYYSSAMHGGLLKNQIYSLSSQADMSMSLSDITENYVI